MYLISLNKGYRDNKHFILSYLIMINEEYTFLIHLLNLKNISTDITRE